MGKLSVVLKEEEVLTKLCRLSPAAWVKLRRTCRLFVWRLEEPRLQALQNQLINEFNLMFMQFHDLCEHGDTEAVWLLISQGMSVRLRDHEGATLLQKATHSGNLPLLQLLIEKGGHLNAKGAYGYTPLHEACYYGHPQVVTHLLVNKANVDALSKNGSTPLLIAAREGHNPVCEALLQYGADADDGGDKGWTPLTVAAGEGHYEVCKTLLRYGAGVQGFAGDGRYERSALHEAAEQGQTRVVDLLIGSKADPTHTFDEDAGNRVTARDLAMRHGHTQVVQLLSALG